MSVYTTVVCQECKADVAHGNAVASVYEVKGNLFQVHHTIDCGCKQGEFPCIKPYTPVSIPKMCPHCNSTNLYEYKECDE